MRHFLNGIEITPRNRNEIGVVSDFSGNPEILNLNTESVILPREAMDIIKQHILAVGVFEGRDQGGAYQHGRDSGAGVAGWIYRARRCGASGMGGRARVR